MSIFQRKDKTENAAGAAQDPIQGLSEQLMKNVRLFKLDQILLPILTIILGILFLIWPEASLQIIARIVGVVLVISGICSAVFFFRSSSRLLLHSGILCIGMINIVIGIWILYAPDFIIALMPKLIGLLLLVNGIVTFTAAVTLAKSNYSRWWITLILSIIIFAAGIFFLVRPFEAAMLFMRIAGASLVYTGLANLYTYFTIKRAIKEVTKTVQNAAETFSAQMQQAQAEAAGMQDTADTKTETYY